MAETVVVLEPGEERAQKIAKAMASQTAGDILRFIGEGQKTSTEISEHLSLPMNTAKYHIENLLDAGLISVAATKYSVKGREVKVYTLTNQLLIVAPKQLNVRSLLLKYASLFGIVAFASIILAVLSPFFTTGGVMGGGLNGASRMAAQDTAVTSATAAAGKVVSNVTIAPEMMTVGSKGVAEAAGTNLTPHPGALATVAPACPDTIVSVPGTMPDPALAFLLGGILVIVILACYEVYLWHRTQKK